MKQKLTQEERQEMVVRHQNGESATTLCLEKGIAKSTFYGWVKTLDINKKDGLKVKDTFKLNQKLSKLEQKFEVLTLVNCSPTSPLKTRLYELEKLHGQFSVYVLCEALCVDRGTFYNHILRNRKEDTSYKKHREDISKLVLEIFDKSRQIYGATKIANVLKARGTATSSKYVRTIMKELGLASIRTTSKQDYNLLNPKIKTDKIKLNFNVFAPNEVWVSDTTSFKINDKWYYICAIIDLYSRKVIAYKTSPKHSTNLIIATFKIA